MKFAATALLAFTGLASAAPFFSTQGAASQTMVSGRGIGLYNIDLAGIQSWDAAGSPNNHTLSIFIGANVTVAYIGWDNVVIETNGASWLSEARINFLASPIGLNLAPGSADAFPGAGGPYSSGGLIDLAALDPTYPFQVGADGMLHIEFFESFDDVAGAPDAVWLSGTLSINFPTPGGTAVLLAGFGFCARRRR